MDKDTAFMQRALDLARRGEGLTRPNPPVGAVLVQNGKIISEGFHKKAGGDHAERSCLNVYAKKQGARSLKTATLYVTLEPCSTHGRTPPCCDLILERGVGRVVVGCNDPNPAHAGRGIRKLRRAGVDVITKICNQESLDLIAPFKKRILTGFPFVTLKLGVTFDGKIADKNGASKWITGKVSRGEVQELRRRSDAIMVGAGTVRADNPSLLPRPAKGRAPWRVVVGENIPKNSVVLNDEASIRTIVLNDSLKKILHDLAKKHDVMHVLCEGGGELASSLVRSKLVDEFMIFMAPSIMGGSGVPMFGENGWLLKKMPQLSFQKIEKCGDDILIRATLNRE